MRIVVPAPVFRAVEGGNRGKHGARHSGPFASGESYSAGDGVRETGIYEVRHESEHRVEHEVVLLAGDVFPKCETCQAQVKFRLIRTAPYIFQDADFEDA
ncbi:MAG TPA: hypothetical protein VGC88_04780 [Terriglobales bacterium]